MARYNEESGRTGHQFGTFAGVFTPSILTILGVIMFLRAGFVVGQAGVSGALIILLVAELISVLTALSLAGISTNTPVSGGGAYFLISRVLGPGFGGSIGLALFLAQALSVPFYILGFTEALVQSFPMLRPWFVVLATGTALLLFAVNYVGANWAIRTQYLVMTLLGLSLVAFFGGALLLFKPETLAANWKPAYMPNMNFWVVFAIYFPAVTGIMAGVNMSGDLKNPSKSLVTGTFAAIVVGGLIYLLEIVVCGGAFDRASLINRPFESLVSNALLGTGFLVIGGVFAATLSSAMGSFMGAPRVMQALARDDTIGMLEPFAKGSRKGNEPRRALGLTLIITLVVFLVAAGSAGLEAFDRVAAVVTMFFLCTYGMVNLAAFVESFSSNPSFRPRFRWFHWTTALAGAASCIGVMILIDAVAAIVAMVIVLALYIVISRHKYRSGYGDARRGFVYSLVTRNLWRLTSLHPHPKNWRPSFLVLSGNPRTRINLLQFAVWLEARRGIVSMAEIVRGTFADVVKRRQAALERAERFVRENDLNVHPEVIVANDFDEGLRVLVQAQSIGPIKPNTILMGWPRERERVVPFVRHLADIRLLDKSVICIVEREREVENASLRIDIWWRGRENGSFMLILAHLLSQNWEWRGGRVRILRAVDDEAAREPSHDAMMRLAGAARLDVDVEIIVTRDPIGRVITKHSQDAGVVFMGFQPPEEDRALDFYENIEVLTASLPTTILVSSCGEADLLA